MRQNATCWAHMPRKHVETFWTATTHQQPIADFSTITLVATGPPTTLPPTAQLAQASPDDTLRMPDLSNILITYKVNINGIPATALLDTGAQLDFINKISQISTILPQSKRRITTSKWQMDFAKTLATNYKMLLSTYKVSRHYDHPRSRH
jgi:hypothetical protein